MKFKAIILTAVVLLMSATFCNAKSSPEESMQKICRAFFYLDETDLKSLNSSPEQIRQQYFDSLKNSGGDVQFSDDQANRIIDAIIQQMKQKIKFSVKTESVAENNSVVAVTVQGINLNEALNSVQIDETVENNANVSEIVTQAMINAIKNSQQKNPVTVKFNCIYDAESDMWAPEGEGDNLNPLFDAGMN